jgi:3alpha(or 20beta)-hydroxysteroid dehydrogenase
MGERLSGKVVLITGGAAGQGEAEARLFTTEGAKVAICDITDEAGEKLAADVRRSGGAAEYYHLDVADEKAWRQVTAAVRQKFGGLHVLVNNAGIISRHGIDSISLAAWNRTLEVNLTGAMLGMKYTAPLIRDSGGGSIINVSSIGGLTAHYDSAYAASKWGLRGLTKVAAMEYVDLKIRVNSIHPGQITETSFVRDAQPGHVESVLRTIPMGRQGTRREAANLVLFLASDESSFITGAEIAIDGGFTAGAAIRMRSQMRDQIAAAAKSSYSATQG